MGAPRPASLFERIATTIAAPLVVLAAEQIRMPYMVDSPLTRRSNLELPSIVSLGILPFITAYALVEMSALVVPSWRRARQHPVVRARLDRFATVLAVVLALIQGFGSVLAYEAAWRDVYAGGGLLSRAVSTLTLVGGTCLLALVARWATRRGLVNGYLLVLAVSLTGGLRRTGALVASGSATTMVVLVVTVAGTALVLSGYGRVSRSLRVPVPASSIAPVSLSASLVAVPAWLAGWHVATGELARQIDSHQMLVARALALGTCIALAPLLHRPDEMAASARPLGVEVDAQQAAAALLRAMLPSLAYVTLLTFSANALSLAILTALAMDLVASLRAHMQARDLVVVREERRLILVGPMRAVLAARGIDAWVRGSATLGLLQAFAPYAPVEMYVRGGDAERAAAELSVLDADERIEREIPPEAAPAPSESWRGPLLRTLVLAVFVALVPLTERVTTRRKAHLVFLRAQVEIVRVDDLATPFDPSEVETLVTGGELRTAQEPTGTDDSGRRQTVAARYLRVTSARGEGLDKTWARTLPWLETHRLPGGDRWSWQAEVEPDDAEGTTFHVTGLSTVVLTGEDIIANADIVDAEVGHDEGPLGSYYVTVKFRPEAAKRFEEATREWANRRIAILVDGHVESAPVVRTAIAGGRATITMGAGDPEKQLAEAERLAASLCAE